MNEKQIDEVMIEVEAHARTRYSCVEDSDSGLAAIRAKLIELAGWQPIETAPKDQWVLVAYPDGEVSKAIFNVGVWMDWDGDLYGAPTHWQPLLEAPCDQPS